MEFKDIRDDFTSDVYNTLDFLPTNSEANRIIDSFDRVVDDVIVVPKGATNGDMIKAITGEDFSRGASIYNYDLMICEGEYYLAFNVDWWNAPYKRGNSDGSN